MGQDEPQFSSLKPDPRGHNLLVGANVKIDPTASIGANVVLHDDVEIGPGATVKHNCVIGQAPSLSQGSNALASDERITRIGAGATICNNVVILRGVRVGERTIIGDHCFMREGATVGEDCVMGHATAMGVRCRVGDRVRAQGPTGISPAMIVEDDVFISAYLAPITDRTSGRDPMEKNGIVTLRRGCRIGANVSLMPGVEIGEEALVGAGAVVLESVGTREKVVGTPARVIGHVTDDELIAP